MDGLKHVENLGFMTPEEIKSWEPYKEFPKIGEFKQPLRQRMEDVGEFSANQAAGRRWAIGCVSLEITQRCNLDCTLCYLSDSAEAVKDIPLQEIFRRIDVIYRHYGPHTDIQISGGDPTLRDRSELVQIVKRIKSYNMECSLFTNGILAKRDLLQELAEAGMSDVAFHVDLTQERNGYATEEELNVIRLKYIDRAKNLGLNIFFNTTIHEGNFHEVPKMVEFFRKHAEHVELCSFQIQADQGRGVLRERDFMITQETVMQQLEKGAGTKINFDMPLIGHPKCNKKAVMYEANGNLYNLADTRGFIEKMVSYAPLIQRSDKVTTSLGMIKAVLKRPQLWGPALVYLFTTLSSMLPDIIRARGKVNKLSFFIHNFMDACKLEKDRIQGCVFMVATSEGPISMCMHNAKRDDYILKPFKVKEENETEKVFNPLTGELTEEISNPVAPDYQNLPIKNLKGRLRKEAVAERAKKRNRTKVTEEVNI